MTRNQRDQRFHGKPSRRRRQAVHFLKVCAFRRMANEFPQLRGENIGAVDWRLEVKYPTVEKGSTTRASVEEAGSVQRGSKRKGKLTVLRSKVTKLTKAVQAGERLPCRCGCGFAAILYAWGDSDKLVKKLKVPFNKRWEEMCKGCKLVSAQTSLAEAKKEVALYLREVEKRKLDRRKLARGIPMDIEPERLAEVQIQYRAHHHYELGGARMETSPEERRVNWYYERYRERVARIRAERAAAARENAARSMPQPGGSNVRPPGECICPYEISGRQKYQLDCPRHKLLAQAMARSRARGA